MPESLSSLRHAARGHLNAIKLCASAMELECTRNEHLEFITDVINSSDKLDEVMVQIGQFFEENPALAE